MGRSDMYILKRVSESTPPCGTPVFVFLLMDFVLLNRVCWVLPLM